MEKLLEAARAIKRAKDSRHPDQTLPHYVVYAFARHTNELGRLPDYLSGLDRTHK